MLTFQNDTLDKLCAHAQAEYPRECCGMLLGKRIRGQRIAYRVIRAENAAGETENTAHFQIDPFEIAKAELAAEQELLEIVGFYHSHPDHDAVPSDEDTRYIIAGYSYPILSVQHGQCVRVRSFERLGQSDAEAQEEILVKEKQHADLGICIGNPAGLCEQKGKT